MLGQEMMLAQEHPLVPVDFTSRHGLSNPLDLRERSPSLEISGMTAGSVDPMTSPIPRCRTIITQTHVRFSIAVRDVSRKKGIASGPIVTPSRSSRQIAAARQRFCHIRLCVRRHRERAMSLLSTQELHVRLPLTRGVAMRFRLCRRFVRLTAFAVLLLAGSGGFALAGTSNGILYETFGSNGVAAINLTDPLTGLGYLSIPATNIAVGGGKVYFQSGDTIYSSSPDLVGLTAVLTNTQAPTGLALNASGSILYETFGSNGVAAINLTDPLTGLGYLSIPATNIAVGGGEVYFQSGDTIYSSSPGLVGLTAVLTNTQAPTGLALDASGSILYETFGSNGVAAINLTSPLTGLGYLSIPATNIAVGGGKVYFQSGDTIYSSSPDLVGLTAVLTNTQAPAGLALVTTASVPEPGSMTLVLVALMCVASRHAWSLTCQKAQGFDVMCEHQ